MFAQICDPTQFTGNRRIGIVTRAPLRPYAATDTPLDREDPPWSAARFSAQ
ncbi:hypothetical protein GCM10010400_37220 [Streptomyces aculeolatus]